MIDHDHIFKDMIVEYPRDSIEFYARSVSDDLPHPVKFTPVRQETLQEFFGDGYRALDTPLLVEFPDGTIEAVLFLFEEETDPYSYTIHKTAHYMLDIVEMLKTDRIVPVVIFLKKGKHPTALRMGIEQKTFLQFEIISCDLPLIPAEAYYESCNIVARLNLVNMKYPRKDKVKVFAKAVEGLNELEPNRKKQLKWGAFIETYGNLSQEETERFKRDYLEQPDYQERTMGIMTEIKNEGKQEGKFEMLADQLQTQFGPLPEWATDKLKQAKSDELQTWSLRILKAKSLDDVLV